MEAELIKVLYIDGVGPFGGASRSLFEAISNFPAGTVAPYFMSTKGTTEKFYGQVAEGMVLSRGLTRFDNTHYGHYRGVRWLIMLRELFHAPFTALALHRVRKQWPDIDLIHVNEVTEIIPGLLARRLLKKPMVVHVRSPQNEKPLRRTCWINARLRDSADAVVAINENTRATLPADLNVTVIQNSFTAKKASHSDPAILAKLAALRPTSLKVGFVGNLHLSKGLWELIDAASIVRKAGRDVEFVIVGGATSHGSGPVPWLLNKFGLLQDVLGEINDRIRAAGVEDTFHLLGPTNDIQCVYEKLNVICFPSHFDAPGRPVFEAAFSSVPSIVAVRHPRKDTLIDGETGIAIPSPAPDLLAAAIMHFADDRTEVTRMGAAAKALADANFVPAINSRRLLELYRSVLRMPTSEADATAHRS